MMKPTPTKQPKPVRLPAGLKVRSDLRAGAWKCNDCQGKAMGNQLFKPDCNYCQQA